MQEKLFIFLPKKLLIFAEEFVKTREFPFVFFSAGQMPALPSEKPAALPFCAPENAKRGGQAIA